MFCRGHQYVITVALITLNNPIMSVAICRKRLQQKWQVKFKHSTEGL